MAIIFDEDCPEWQECCDDANYYGLDINCAGCDFYYEQREINKDE